MDLLMLFPYRCRHQIGNERGCINVEGCCIPFLYVPISLRKIEEGTNYIVPTDTPPHQYCLWRMIYPGGSLGLGVPIVVKYWHIPPMASQWNWII